MPPSTKAHLEEYAKIRAEVRRRFKRENKPTGWWHRLVLGWKFERAVRDEMKRRFPPGALYSC